MNQIYNFGVAIPADFGNYPLCQYFLSGYLSAREDPTNFPSDEFPGLLDLYEGIFKSALDTLALSKDALRSREEFDFDSGDGANLESAIGVLRTVETLRQMKFLEIELLKPPGADIVCEKDGQRVCCEVKTITKQSTGRSGFFFADQLYEKIMENLAKVRMQLSQSAAQLQCTVTMFACVSNWFDQAIYLGEDSYQYVVNRLEKDQLEGDDNFLESLKGIDGVLFVTKFGNRYLFLNENGKSLDR
jgi:hypothetical protein